MRLLVGVLVPLSPDEAYYWVWSQAPAAGYLDHPPMVALWIRAGTALAGDTAFGIRVLGPLSAAIGSLLLAQAGNALLGRPHGTVAAVLLNATLLFGVGSVTMTPDTPLLLFWTATLAALVQVLRTGDPRWWLAAGVAAGLALASKYTALLLAPAILAWLALAPSERRWLATPWPYLAALLAAAVFAPVVAWNAAHDWAGFLKQGGRVNDWRPGRALQFLGELIGGQVGLATPLLALQFAAGMVLAIRRFRDPAWSLLACLTVLPAAVFLQHALGDRVQGNWPAVIYPAAAIAAAGLTGGWRRLRIPAAALGAALTLLVWVQAIASPLPLPHTMDPTALRLAGWRQAADGIAAAARAQGARYVVADNYGVAAMLARLLPADIPVLGLEDRWRFFALPDATPLIDGQPGLLVRSDRRRDAPPSADFAAIERQGLVARPNGGMTAESFRLYRVTGRAGDEPIVVLPRP